MRISNAVEFFHFSKKNGLQGLAPEIQALIKCLEEYGNLCACDSAEVKQTKFNQCKNFYLAFASRAVNHKAVLISKVADGHLSLYNDKQLLVSLNR